MNDNFVNPTKLAYDEVLKELNETKNELKEEIANLKQISESLANGAPVISTSEITSMDSLISEVEPTKEEMIAEMQNLQSKPLYDIVSISDNISAYMEDSNVKTMNLTSEQLINISKKNPVENKNLI